MKKTVATLLCLTALSTSAYAQTAQPAERAAPAATTTAHTEKMALKGQWRASKVKGLNVYNEANEKLGDINELIIDKNGKINAVVIGIGGFLGMGEHDIAVSMDKLKFIEEPVRTSATSSTTTTKETTVRDTTTGAATTTQTTAPARTTNTTTATVNDWTPDHAVLNATKDQLKAMPEFKYSDYN